MRRAAAHGKPILQKEWNLVSCDSSIVLEGTAGEVCEARQGQAKGKRREGETEMNNFHKLCQVNIRAQGWLGAPRGLPSSSRTMATPTPAQRGEAALPHHTPSPWGCEKLELGAGQPGRDKASFTDKISSYFAHIASSPQGTDSELESRDSSGGHPLWLPPCTPEHL